MVPTKAYQIDERIKELCVQTTSLFWELIATIKVFRDSRLWEELDYDSFSQYLAQPEVSLRESTVNDYIRVYDQLSLVDSVAQRIKYLPRSKARLIAPQVNEENAEELVEKALTLSWSDLRKEVQPPREIQLPTKPIIKWCETHQKWWVIGDYCSHP